MSTALILIVGAFCTFDASAQPAFKNGSFEEVDASGGVVGWNFACSNGCQGRLKIDTESRSDGSRSVCLSSTTEHAPHVYCGLSQTVDSLVPEKTYRFSLKAKSEEIGSCWFGGGPGWFTRFFFPPEPFDWQEFTLDWTCPADCTSFEFRINVDSPTEALWIDDVCVAEVQRVPQNDPATAQQTTDLITQQEQRLPAIEQALASASSGGIPVFYPKADFTVARMFCGFCRDDLANERVPRAFEVAGEVKELLDRAEREMRQGIDVPVLKKDSPIEIRDGSFWAQCTANGKDEVQPVFLTGYGHFLRVVEDLPLLADMGINVIQIEIGPDSIVFEDGVRTDAITNRILPALDRARDNGARVCLLLSPHYFPAWAFAKWPALPIDKPGFLRNTLDAPQVRDIYRKQLEALIPLIKDHPALHSICLSNEPVSEDSQNDPFRIGLWRAYIERKHKSIEALNTLYGTDYASFAEVPHPNMTFDEKTVPLYDGVRFNQECFAEWHAWMVEVIHSIAPNLPCHAKVMVLPVDRGTVLWGTDPYEFAQLSQINGNDCYFLPSPNGTRSASGWAGQGMYYDLQRSMKHVPIFNTENHIIRDREENHIDGGHIYAAIWQGAVHGQGASTTWVWERSYDRKSDFEGSILHRPSCVAAMSRCALDLMRCAREVAAIQNIVPKVAILYSNASTIWDKAYVGTRSRLYEALNFCGIPIGFVTDEQIAAGLLDQYACVVVPGATHAARDAIEGIRELADKGGFVLAYGPSNLEADEYGRSVEPPHFTAVLEPTRTSAYVALRDAVFKELSERGLGPVDTIQTEEGKLPYGVEWRSVTLEGRRLINLVNFLRTPQVVNLPDGQWIDLISGAPLSNPLTLQTNTPVLAMSG